MMTKFIESGNGLMHQDSGNDKYTFKHEVQVNCQSRLHICKAVCCRFPFAIYRQDLEEGIINWEFRRLYLFAYGEDGYCVHLDRENYRCMVWEHRSVPDRGFDSGDNEKWKVWKDFAEMVINDEMVKQIDDSNRKVYTYQKSNDNRVEE